MLAAALDYANRGWPVFPLRPGTKRPATEHGCHDATTDPAVLAKWWTANPTANVGIATGSVVDAFDADTPGAAQLIDTAVRERGLPVVARQSTPRPGWHILIPATGRPNAARLGSVDGLDFRGRGGYIVAAPSRLNDRPDPYQLTMVGEGGDGAEWAAFYDSLRADKEDGGLSAELPLSASLGDSSRERWARTGFEAELAKVTSSPVGARNNTLNTSALKVFGLVESGDLDKTEVWQALTAAGVAVGLAPSEVAATIDSAARAATPRVYVPRESEQLGWAGPAVAPAAPASDESLQDALVERRYRELRADKLARERLRTESRPAMPPIDLDTVDAILTRPAPAPFRVEDLMPSEAGTEIVAQRKVGKTTFELNLARSLLTGEDFLGRFGVRPLSGDIGFLNYEVSAWQLARWAHEVDVPSGRLHLANLRGVANPLSDQERRGELAATLRARGIEVLIVDPFGRAYGGENQNDAGEVGRWLADLDAFARSEVGATDVVLAVHAGWNGERSRGSTALEDWADAIVNLTRDDDGRRFLRAVGRDVDIDEDELGFDAEARRQFLTGGGGRRSVETGAKIAATRAVILEALEANPDGLSGKELQVLTGIKDRRLTTARQSLVADGVIRERARSGRGGGRIYALAPPKIELPEVAENPPVGTLEGAPNPYRGSGPLQTPSKTEHAETVCRTCGLPLDPSVTADGFRTHPTCTNEGDQHDQ